MSLRTVFSLVIVALLAASLHADSVITADQDNTIYKESSTGGDYVVPLDEILTVNRKYSATYARKIYTRFDLSGTSYDADASATFALTYLSMNFTPTANDKLMVRGLNSGFTPGVDILGTDWQETEITWNNAPGNADDDYLFDTSTTTEIDRFVMNSTPLAEGDVLEFTIDRIGDYVQADGSVTIMLSMISYGDSITSNFASTRNTTYDGPTLTVASVPEPATLGVIAFGALYFRIRRKQS